MPLVEERIEALYVAKRFVEALELSVNSYSKPMLSKIQNAYLNELLKTRQIEKARHVIVNYLGQERDLWVHWLTLITKMGLLNQFIQVIPMERKFEKAS